jgi:hypothetical protein
LYLGNLGKKMKKTILILIGAVQILYANPDTDSLKQQVLTQLPFVDGWCSREKAVNFIDLAVSEQPEIWVEIGVFGGSSLLPTASAFKFLQHGKVIAIDPWDKIECIKYYDPIKDNADLKWWGNLNLNQIYSRFLNLLKANQLEPYCEIIRTTSEKAAANIGQIDVLYIDGNHSEIISTQDVKLYLPKVRSNGYIWMNDSTWEQRQQAVEILAEQCDVIKMIDNGNCILFRKR